MAGAPPESPLMAWRIFRKSRRTDVCACVCVWVCVSGNSSPAPRERENERENRIDFSLAGRNVWYLSISLSPSLSLLWISGFICFLISVYARAGFSYHWKYWWRWCIGSPALWCHLRTQERERRICLVAQAELARNDFRSVWMERSSLPLRNVRGETRGRIFYVGIYFKGR